VIRARARAWWPAVLWAAVVLALGSIPRMRSPIGTFPHMDKLVHGFEYGLLAFLLGFGLARDPRTSAWSAAVKLGLVVVAIAAFGGLDEWHQSAIPGRDMSGWDWLADVAGGILGAVAAALLPRKREQA
jgi:VanZ family protein